MFNAKEGNPYYELYKKNKAKEFVEEIANIICSLDITIISDS